MTTVGVKVLMNIHDGLRPVIQSVVEC